MVDAAKDTANRATTSRRFPKRFRARGRPATVGVRLGQLGTMMKDIFPAPTETAAEQQQRDPGRQKLTGYTSQRFAQNQASDYRNILVILERSPRLADASVDGYRRSNAAAPAKTDELVSLLGLVYAYLDMGKSGLIGGYAKTIAPVMARTDFGTLFDLLDDVP